MSENHIHDLEIENTHEETIKALEQALKEAKQAAEDNKTAQVEADKKAEDIRLRGMAELENMRRRAQLDVEKAHKYGIERLSRELLLVIDSLEQALMVESSDTALKEGIQLTFKLLLDSLDKFGIQQINPIGELFDPVQHEAISLQPTNDPEEANRVLVVAQKGFTLKDRILRPARVVVASAVSYQTSGEDTLLGDEKPNIDKDLV